MFFNFAKSIIKYGKLKIIDTDGKAYLFGNTNPSCVIRINSKSIKNKILINPELYIGEAIVDEDITIEEGSLEDFINIISYNYLNISNNFLHSVINFLSKKIRVLQQLNFISKSYNNVAHHYDIDEKIYKMFLDKDMQYSCAYFHNDNISLDQAQEDKKNILIKKLNIKNKKMRVLDIGCGWGGMAIQIAKNTGAYVKGITLSKNQYQVAQQRIKKSKLEKQIDFELIDYRELSGQYDRIISVGMFEHVGLAQYNKFFSCIKNLLTDDGIMVLHSIGTKLKPHQTNPWIRKYIFPGGYIPSLSEVTKFVEKQDLWISDLEIWRLHYAKTLKNWRFNFNKNRSKISNTLDEKFCRMWEFYLLISEYSFRNMGNMVFQMQITKNPDTAPLTRDYIYN